MEAYRSKVQRLSREGVGCIPKCETSMMKVIDEDIVYTDKKLSEGKILKKFSKFS